MTRGGPALTGAGVYPYPLPNQVVYLSNSDSVIVSAACVATPGTTATTTTMRITTTSTIATVATTTTTTLASGGISNETTGTLGRAIGAIFARYFNAINVGDYADRARSKLGPTVQAQRTEAQFSAALSTSYDVNVTLESVSEASPGTATADVTFTSRQDSSQGPNGDSCDNWTLVYTMIQAEGYWLIQRSTGQAGVAYQAC